MVPFKNPKKDKEWRLGYEAERRLGLRRSGGVGEVLEEMDARREARAAYLAEYAKRNRERIAARRREVRRKERAESEAAALGRVLGQVVTG